MTIIIIYPIIGSEKGGGMGNERLNFLKEVHSREEFLTLSLEAAKLYLVLIIAARWPEKEGNISFRTIREALGHHFHANRLKKALSILSDRGLIQLYPPSLKIPANYRHHDLWLYYKIKDLPFTTK